MTVITENFVDLAGIDDSGTVDFYCFNPRRSSDSSSVITQKKVTVVIDNGVMESPDLDPGPARAHITLGTWRRTYDFVIPLSGPVQLFSLEEIVTDPLTQKPTVQGPPGPQGDPGPPGTDGDTGPAGPPNALSIGTVVGGLTAGATLTGTSPAQTLNLTLPKGDPAHWFDGSGPPGTISGQVDGDHYVDLAPGSGGGDVYRLVSGTWTLVGNIEGPAGTPSSATTSVEGIIKLAGVLNGTSSLPTFGAAADATVSVKGIVQLAGDLGGTAASPTVPNKADKTTTISAGTGLTGGGDLSANRTLSVSYGTTASTAAEGNDSRITSAVPNTRTVTAGTGLTGGGDLSTNRTFAVSYGTTSGTATEGNDTRVVNAVQTTRTITAGTGLTGGGDLSANRTLAVSYGSSSGTAAEGNDSRLSNTRTPTAGTSPYDLCIVAFAQGTTRATGTGDFSFGVKIQRAAVFTSVTYRGATNGGSGNLVVELRKNGSAVSGSAATIAAASITTGGTATGSWSFAVGDILTVQITTADTTPGAGLIADILGTG